MSKTSLVLVVALAWNAVAGAMDMAFYAGAPNDTGWYDIPTQLRDIDTIIEETGVFFTDIQVFLDDEFPEFGAWIDENTGDGEMDILWLNGCMPSVLYPHPNLQPDGSRIERWLDGGNMVINVGDWFGYVSYEGGSWHGSSLEWGAANILDLSPGIIHYADDTSLQTTPQGRQYLPSLPEWVITYRPIVLWEVQPPWEVAAIFASWTGTDDPVAERFADPVVIHNTQTDAYVAFINQTGGGPDIWVDRGRVCTEFLLNWVMPVVQNNPLARNPRPADRAVLDVDTAAALRWSSGGGAIQHDVYVGFDRDQVEQADPNAAAIYRGRQAATAYALSELLTPGVRCYWRIDEVNEADVVHKGAVWSFTVADYLVVDGFESYDEVCNRIVFTWLDGTGHPGSGACGVAPFGGNPTDSTVARATAPQGKRTVMHSGAQAMELIYDNSQRKRYAETARTLNPVQDWTRFDVNTLTLHIRGDSGNLAQPLYVELEDDAQHRMLVNHPDPQAVANAFWSRWDIALSEFAAGGVNLGHVKKIVIGVGSRTATKGGGKGRVYLDDIRLVNSGGAARPVAWWEFEEGAGDTAFDSAGLNDGTIAGALWTPGTIGTALWFDGIDDFVDGGKADALNPPEMTLTLWVCPETVDVPTQVVIAKAGSETYEADYALELSSAGFVHGWFGDGTTGMVVFGAGNAAANEWTHLALTRDSRDIAIYMDGGNRMSMPYEIELGDGGYPLRMGGPSPYRGKIDDVRLYDRVLSPQEIEQIAAGQM